MRNSLGSVIVDIIRIALDNNSENVMKRFGTKIPLLVAADFAFRYQQK